MPKLLSLKIRFARKEGQKCKRNVQLTVPAVARASPTLQDAKRSISALARSPNPGEIDRRRRRRRRRPTGSASEGVNVSDTIVTVEVESGCSDIDGGCHSVRPSVSRYSVGGQEEGRPVGRSVGVAPLFGGLSDGHSCVDGGRGGGGQQAAATIT